MRASAVPSGADKSGDGKAPWRAVFRSRIEATIGQSEISLARVCVDLLIAIRELVKCEASLAPLTRPDAD